MRDTHITKRELQKFLEQGAEEEHKRLLLHLLAVCPECYAVGGYILDLYRAGAIDLSFSTIDLGLAKSRADAPVLWKKLSRYPPDRRRALIRDTRRFRSWGLCEFLCLESARAATSDPETAVELAELAVEISSVLEEWQPAEESWLWELRAYAWAHLGNARRVAGNLLPAEQAFSHAESWWQRGERKIGDALGYEARIYALKASLRRDQRRLNEALTLLDLALGADTGGTLSGIILINKAKVLEELGELDRAITLLTNNASRIAASGDVHLLLCLRHNLLDTLSKAGRYEEAHALLPQVERLSREAGGDLERLRLKWTQARVTAGVGDTEKAFSMFDAVRQEFAELGIAFDTALVSIELAAHLLPEGRLPEVKALARETLLICEAQGVHREALAAVAIFQRAAEAETLTVEFTQRLLSYLKASRRNPVLRFQTTNSVTDPGKPGHEEKAH